MQLSSSHGHTGSAKREHDLVLPPAQASHSVQFYEDDAFLAGVVADFLAAGLTVHQSVIVIATPAHRDAFLERLRAEQLDVEGARSEGRFILLDARETLGRFVVDGMPDAARFRATVTPIIDLALTRSNGTVLRFYGEMVDLLWKDGHTDGAIKLEELWNELGETYSFSLLCAYAMGNFYKSSHAEHFEEVCRRHTHVIPTERYTTSDENTRLIEISLLQQRAHALEAEIEHRKDLERRLRESLTAHQRLETSLRQREQELRDFLENATEGIHGVAPDGTILWANKAELDLLGYTAEEYIGHSIVDFHADKSVIADMLERLKRHETLYNYEARLRCKDGSLRTVLVNSNVLWRDGDFVQTRCFTRDITNIKAAAIERERLLERERAARAEAEAANRAKSEFLAVMSHELRTPLNAIGGYAELMSMGIRGSVTPQQREDLERIQTSQRHLLGLINDVLNYAKLETGNVHYDIQNVVVRGELARAEGLVEPQARAKGLQLTVGDCAPRATVRADADKLRQILVNLLSNAIKFTNAGGRIHLECTEEPTHMAFRVQDSGIGIPPEKIDAIFEPFVQVRSGLTRTAEGTGLGLAISRDLARAMGGELVAESVPGSGSTFTLRLPKS
jgi:PAS domain S-box-containing protein